MIGKVVCKKRQDKICKMVGVKINIGQGFTYLMWGGWGVGSCSVELLASIS